MIGIRKFYDRWIDGSYGAYKDVDGDWVEFHQSKNIPEKNECYFTPVKNITSATICTNCGKEKMLHTIGEGLKVSKTIITLK